MQRRAARWRAVGLVAALCAAPSAAPAISEMPREPEGEVWVPALAAWGASATPPGSHAPAPAPALGTGALAPTLVSVGQGSADAATGASADYPAPAGDRDETTRWVPGIALQSSVLGQQAEGSVDSNSTVTYEYIVRANGGALNIDPPKRLLVTRSLREGKVNFFTPQTPQNNPTGFQAGTPNNPGGLVLPAKGSDLFLTPVVGLSTEIMTPGLQDVPGRPRLFLHNDAQLAFSLTRSVGREGVPDGAQFPPIATSPRSTEVEVKGVGSITEAEVKTLLLSGGAGVAFTVDGWERRFRIKPSFEYLRQKIDVRGKLVRAFRYDTGRTAVFGPGSGIPSAYLPPIALESEDSLTSYGIGPGLELEMDAGRAGPVMLSLFVAGQAYRMLGNRDVEMQDTGSVEVPDENPTTPAVQDVGAEWNFQTHAWSYRGGLGVRFRWLPEGR